MGEGAAALAAALVLGSSHLLAARLRFLHLTPRSRVLSAAGGVSVAYVFVHLLPEIAEAQRAVDEVAGGPVAAVERHAYVVALAGLALFYGLERATMTSRTTLHPSGDAGTDPHVFGVSVGSFALYNAIIGYLLLDQARDAGGGQLAMFTIALALHLLVNDLGLRDHHRRRYDRWGRWVLAAAPLVGLAAATVVEVSDAAIGLAIAFVGGGVVLNVMKEELPERRASHFGAFAAGAAGYAALLLAV